MDALSEAIRTTPIIDNHAHPLLRPAALSKYPLLSITTEAHGDALPATTSSLPHFRAVRQLAEVLECESNWDAVVAAIAIARTKPDDAWNRRCFEGIETVLIDDGLDGQDEVFGVQWHDKLSKSPCKRIARIEKIAETIARQTLYACEDYKYAFSYFDKQFKATINECNDDPLVVGFKSVICYRVGLDIPTSCNHEEIKSAFDRYFDDFGGKEGKLRIDRSELNTYLVHTTAQIIRDTKSEYIKPLQFHTGLGDNDITLTQSSPSHLQNFIRLYPTVPIVLLHASYPYTKEAGYLASVYSNVYADIGEVFPMVSRDGQDSLLREILELCPSSKILWSTDGHWFPETYLLATIQIREALTKVGVSSIYCRAI